jgi:hypothetical protein
MRELLLIIFGVMIGVFLTGWLWYDIDTHAEELDAQIAARAARKAKKRIDRLYADADLVAEHFPEHIRS